MKVWVHVGFLGRYPVGTAAVVVAETACEAAELLAAELSRIGLGQEVVADEFELIATDCPAVRILNDGDY